MSIISIGAKLIRDTKLGRVVTETVGDKIFTNFYTKGGKLAKQRVKQIVRTNVGNKSVITIKKVEKEKNLTGVRICQLDRVYDQNKNIFGIRDIEKTDNEKFVTKISRDGYIQDKYFEDGKIKRRCFSNEDDIDSRGRVIVTKTYYNNLGLPVPQGMEPLDFNSQTLKQMRKWAVDHNVVYAEKGSGLTFLNKTDDLGYLPNANEKLNNLDTYL